MVRLTVKLYEKHRKFIQNTARRFAVPGHGQLAYEDLVSEGYLLLAAIARRRDVRDFDHLFRHSMIIRCKELRRAAFCQKRKAIVLDLETFSGAGTELVLKQSDAPDRMLFDELLRQAWERLSPRAFAVLLELSDPSEETRCRAVQESVRSRHLSQSQGHHVRAQMRVTHDNIARTLNISKVSLWRCLLEIRAYFNGERGRKKGKRRRKEETA